MVNPDPESSDNRACKSVSQGAEDDTSSALHISEMAGIDKDELVPRRETDAGTREGCCLPTGPASDCSGV